MASAIISSFSSIIKNTFNKIIKLPSPDGVACGGISLGASGIYPAASSLVGVVDNYYRNSLDARKNVGLRY